MSTVKERLDNSASIFQKYDSPISITTRMAQFVVESQAGASELFKKSNNGFGIKASAPWTGDKVLHNSNEVGGARDSYFRKYPTLEASIADNASFYTSTDYRANTAYKKAIDAESYEEEANALTGIYAGDPLYGQKLIKAVKDYDLTKYDEERVTMAERRNFADVLKQVYGTEIINWDGFKGRGAGRRGGNPQGAIVHNDYGAANGKGYINWLTDARLGNPSAGYAHYYGDRKYMMRAVPTYQGAWHAGDYARGNFTGHGKPANWGNMQLLGYEVNQSRHFATTNREFRLNEEAVFIMIAEDFLFYGLVPNRQTVWLHNEFTSTSCPHRSWELHVGTGASYNQANRNKLKDYFVGRIQYWMDVLNHKRPIPAKNYLPEDGEPQEVNPSDKTYIVQKGDYLYKIGEMFGVDWKDIKVWNNLEANVIYTGQELIVSADLYNPPVEEPEVVEPDNNNTPDIDTEIVDEVEGDEETPALELEENQYLRWDGKIVEVREVK